MMPSSIPVSVATQTTLQSIAARTGRSLSEVLEAAVEEFRQRHAGEGLIQSIPGVNPTDVWEAAEDADAGRLATHQEVFALLRRRV